MEKARARERHWGTRCPLSCGSDIEMGLAHSRASSPSANFYPFFFGGRFGSPSKIGYRNKVGSLILTSLLEDLEELGIRRFESLVPLGGERPQAQILGLRSFQDRRSLVRGGGGGGGGVGWGWGGQFLRSALLQLRLGSRNFEASSKCHMGTHALSGGLLRFPTSVI